MLGLFVCLVWLVILCLDSANVKLLDLDKMDGEEIRRTKYNQGSKKIIHRIIVYISRHILFSK